MFANYISAVNKRIGQPEERAANWDLDGGKAAERWWVEG
jgi:peptide/nickel transport system substrate-binding protein